MRSRVSSSCAVDTHLQTMVWMMMATGSSMTSTAGTLQADAALVGQAQLVVLLNVLMPHN
jgi:hypothetical protein